MKKRDLNLDYEKGMGKVVSPSGTVYKSPDNKDHMALSEDAARMGDFTTAAYEEVAHNEKNTEFNMGYDNSYKYKAFLPFEYKDFEYDYTKDPTYRAYENQYERGAKRAVEDTMGAYAGMTGGMPSSYAVSAAGQAGAEHMAHLSDKIPELEQLAYQKYLNDKNFAYNQRLDEQNAIDGDWRRGYTMDRDAVGDRRYADETAYNRGVYADETAYNRGRDAVGDKRYEDDTAYNRGRDYFEITGDPSGLVGTNQWTPEAGEAASARVGEVRTRDDNEYWRSVMSNAAVDVANMGDGARAMYPELTDDEWAQVKSMATVIKQNEAGGTKSSGGRYGTGSSGRSSGGGSSDDSGWKGGGTDDWAPRLINTATNGVNNIIQQVGYYFTGPDEYVKRYEEGGKTRGEIEALISEAASDPAISDYDLAELAESMGLSSEDLAKLI